MKISYNWLKTFIDIESSLDDMCDKLTMSGLEVEHVVKTENIKGGLEGLVTGEVISKSKHPNADKLSTTIVNVGGGIELPIVCGAPNVDVGQKVVIAPVGTTIHPSQGDSFKIKKAKIRGEVSEGMICAEDEIGLGDGHDGIMVLPAETEIGIHLKELYNIESDYQIEIAIIPNRGDAISHLGVARELQALTGKKYKKPALQALVSNNSKKVDVSIKNSEGCPRYAGIVVSGVNVAPSPQWLQDRLKAIDLKPINNVVDVTNFINHELGQPLHAFDLSKLNGDKVIVRNAEEGETLTTLDDVERELKPHNLVICNETTPVALAGVIGGADSGVADSTKNIFIESAYFNPSVVRKTAKEFGLNTDSSYRFERGTDPEMVLFALQRAANLVLEVAGGEVASDIVDIYPEELEPMNIELNFEEFNRFIGHEIPKEDAMDILQLLEIKVIANNNDKIMVEVPRYRPDVLRPVDVYEEILRVYGFDNIPIPSKVNYIPSIISNNAPNKLRTKISRYLSSIGFNEIMNNSLVANKLYTEEEKENSVTMLNPLSADMNTMRMELLNSALESIAYNVNRKTSSVKFFEFGKTYRKKESDFIEDTWLQISASGNRHPEHWSNKASKITSEQLVNVGESILASLNIAPKQAKKLIIRETISKAQLKKHSLKQEVVSIKINWNRCLELANQKITLKEIPTFPVVRRDLSLVLDKSKTFKEVEQLAKQSLNQFLTDLVLFDVYEGKPLKDNQKSYSVGFQIYNPKKTMEDQEIDKLMDKLISTFETKLEAIIRK